MREKSSRRFLSVVTSIVVVAAMAYVAERRESPLYGQGAAAPAAGAAGRGAAPAQGRGGRGGPGAQAAQTAATNDLTGYWISVVSEDWRWLMSVPERGNADSIPVSAAGRAILNAWDPARDEAEGNQCKGYGAGALSRVPTRVHVTWQDANTLKWETDQGTQTRLFSFGATAEQPAGASVPRSWQGLSVATWEPAAGGRGGGLPGGLPGGPAAPPAAGRGGAQSGWLKVVTSNLKSGYLRKNGVPYSEKATVTEYFQPTPDAYGVRYMIVTTIVEDPEYLTGPFITSSNYKKLPDTNNGWDPQPCSVR